MKLLYALTILVKKTAIPVLKFFRTIRKKLIEHPSKGRKGDNGRKYLLYAIGEILLVVIGILIALQVNNWNDSKKKYRADIEFLNNLRGEIILDTLALSNQIMSYYMNNANGGNSGQADPPFRRKVTPQDLDAVIRWFCR